MCQFKSALLLKDSVFVPDYDFHEDMIKKLGLNDRTHTPDFVRVELRPVSMHRKDIIALPQWEYKVDQDYLPAWYVPSYDEQRVRAAISEWFDAHCWKADQEECPQIDMQSEAYYFIFGSHQLAVFYNNRKPSCWDTDIAYFPETEYSAGPRFFCYDSTRISAQGRASIKAANIRIYDDAQACMYDQIRCCCYDNSAVALYDNAKAVCFDQSSCEAQDFSVVHFCNHLGGKLDLQDHATAFIETFNYLYAVNAYDCSRIRAGRPLPSDLPICLHDAAVCQVFAK